MKPHFVVALENIRSLQNIGAILRTCSFFGVDTVLLVGYSGKTTNTKNQPILHPQVLKSSLGAEKDISILLLPDSAALITFAKEHKYTLLAVEQSTKSKALHEYKATDNNIILVFGNEVTGVSSEVLDASKDILEISRIGKHNSLNVATSVGIVLYNYCH